MKVIVFETDGGKAPFMQWFNKVSIPMQDRIITRLDRVKVGNFGDSKYLKGGVYELRLHFGSGYRIYFGKEKDKIVILLCGGDKKSQEKDIKKAKEYWQDCKKGGFDYGTF